MSDAQIMEIMITVQKVSKYGDFSGPYFPLFGLNAGKYGPEKTPYLDTFHAVNSVIFTVTLTFTPKAGILLKVITVVRIENLALFTGTSIYSIRKSTKNRNRKIKLINKEV